MKVLYFARFRQIIGRGHDDMPLPKGVATAGELIQHLMTTDAGCAAAFANLKTVKVAVNKTHAEFSAALTNDSEVAFFPPVTGG
jgi:sulfur-carrier protein